MPASVARRGADPAGQVATGVALVTDSTAYLPPRLVAEWRLTVVPLQVVVDGRSQAEGLEITSGQIAAALRAGASVTTSRPAPALFAQTYRTLAQRGVTSIVSVHLSGDLSGTCAAAEAAAHEVREQVPVLVVDSRSLGMGLGFAVLAAARVVAAGADGPRAAETATRTAATTRTWFYVDTLEYLRRGGRIGAARALLGSALAVKPVLRLTDGRLEPLERVRTSSRALARLEEILLAEIGEREVDVAVHHLDAPERAQVVAARLAGNLPGLRDLYVAEVGAVVGAHVGPGMVALVVAPTS